jgi:hypothetical protein
VSVWLALENPQRPAAWKKSVEEYRQLETKLWADSTF